MNAVLCLMLLCQAEPSVTIYCSTNFESRAVVSELSRDWLASGDTPMLAEMSRMQLILRDKVHLKPKAGDRRLDGIHDGYPYIQYGRGELISIDRRAFTASGSCLESVFAIVYNETTDFSKWKNACESITLKSELEHVGVVIRWLDMMDPEESRFNRPFYPQWGEADNAGFLFADGYFKHHDGYPAYEKPLLPKKPLMPMPWD